MILVIDAGNTATELGLFRGHDLVRKIRIDSKLLMDHAGIVGPSRSKYSHDLSKALKSIKKAVGRTSFKVKGICISSVVPGLTKTLTGAARKAFKAPMINVDHKTYTGIKLKTKKPAEIGADRIVNAACAYHYFGTPCIIIDMGTATTLDCVDRKGNYIGGVILPGVGISARALNSFTAKLPMVEFKQPKKAIGKNTVECIQSGLYYGNIGMIGKTLERCKFEMKRIPNVVITGGLGRIFCNKIASVKYYWPDITLRGLRLIWEINKGY